MRNALNSVYPEIEVAGFSRDNITVCFYNFVNAVSGEESVVVDLGAGRGAQIEGARSRFLRNLLSLKGKVGQLIGLDIDDAVLSNPYLDKALTFNPRDKLPLEDESVDVIFADWVLEHVEDPDQFAREVNRILKPGGWFCARTPNKWGLIGIAGTLIPNSLHLSVLKKLQPNRDGRDVFETYHRMNSLASIKAKFPTKSWKNYSFSYGYEVGYFSKSLILAWIGYIYNRIAPSFFGLVLIVLLQKKS